MRRLIWSLAACALVFAPAVHAQSTADLARTAAYAAALQNPDGGFAAQAGQASSLGATNSALRVLKYTGGSVPDVLACIAYVKSCHDAASGGFAPTPGGKPDVSTTAVGLMALDELKIPPERWADEAVAFFSRNVKTFEEIRIAVAGLEAVKKTSPDFEAWTAQVRAMRNPDGTFGKGADQGRDTGGAAVALLRMGVELDRKQAILAALQAGQRADGGWGMGEGGSDLGSTYRVMRAFFMLGATPDVDRLLAFVSRCRQSNGSYAARPGAADSGGTYFATIVIRWVRLLTGEPPLVETAGFVPLFNAKDLAGWEGDTALWSVRNGLLVGTSPGLKHNEFLATERSERDFLLKLTFRLVGGEGNSGIQFRSVRVPGHEMSGYQADVGQNYWGCLYDESRRNRVLVQASPEALKAVRPAGWNWYEIRALGDQIRLALNGVQSVEYRETDPAIPRDGRIAVQIHGGGPMQVQFKDIWIQPVPTPTADDARTPGFHLRTIRTPTGERHYTLSIPAGYDGQKVFPVILFLHGAGQRGSDGATPAQLGLGPAIAGRPESFPALAVFPQAEKTWAADSDDARAALAALDDVLNSFKADRNQVILTGLSMGGRGSWELAAAHPDRFAAVVPICGIGRPEAAPALKRLPVWTFVGDADRDQTVLNTRAMVEALRDAGAAPKLTEYRGVGHNSWDRAYNDPALAAWMLAQAHR
jgi:poly(3-hydroxybutyrate) depolymerase/prenyltransferase beta subunit